MLNGKFQDQMDKTRTVEIITYDATGREVLCHAYFNDVRDEQGKVLERGSGFAGKVWLPVALFTEEFTNKEIGFVPVQ